VLHKTELAGTTFTRFILPGGKTVTVMLLEQISAEYGWKMVTGRESYLLTTPQQTFVDGDVATLQDLEDNSFIFDVLPSAPEVKSLDPGTGIIGLPDGGLTSVYSPKPKSAWQPLTPTQLKPADAPAPLPADFKPSNRPRSVAAAPTEADWSRAATYSIPIPKSALTDTPSQQHFLRIAYTGDVARISINGHLLDDNFADGRPWLVGLSRFAPQLQQSGGKLDLSIYPLRPNPPIFFEPGYEPKPDTPPASVSSVELLTQYTLKLKLEPTPAKKP
jgi:beta-galactosidase